MTVRLAAACAVLLTTATVPATGAAQEGPGPIAQSPGEVAVIPANVINANGPTVNSDGRWVVFGGTLDDGRHSVFRADLLNGTVAELTPLPEGAQPGDTVHPRLSANGCVVVAITQVAYDLFRDDDRDQRWDVYRLVVPECGGQPNAWELVSADLTGVAREDVFSEQPPTVSESGAVVAYVHQSDLARDRLATISVIDVTVPIDDPARATEVRGMPIEAPNRAFRYRGAYQPVLSQNGRHLAYTSDAAASDLLPGWGPGVQRGGWATTQVYVWDRLAADQSRAVHLVSGAQGAPARLGADSPAMSEDGRVVVFTSPDRELVPAVLPRCGTECPTQVFRFDRIPTATGASTSPRARPTWPSCRP